MVATLRNRSFFLVWFAGLISVTGDWMLGVALPIYVFVLTGSILLTGAMIAASLLPNLLFGSLAGVFVDRWNRKWTMVIASALQAGTLVPLFFVTSPDRIWLVYVAGFAESTLGLFFQPASSALLPLLVDEEHLVAANSLSGLNRNLSRLIGPALGGVVVATLSLGGVIWSDLVSYALAAVLIALVSNQAARPAPSSATAEQADSTPKRGVWRELGEGLRIVFTRRVVAILFLMLAAMGVGEGLFSTLLIVWVSRILHGGALELGWLMSGQAVGGLLGGVLVALIGKRVRPGRLLAVCAVFFGAIDVVIVNAPLFAPPYLPPSPIPEVTTSLVLFAVALFIAVGILAPGISTGMLTLVQTSVENAYLGRIFALVGVVQALMMLGGIALAGFYGDRLGVIALLNGQGGMYICSGLVAIAFLWRLRTPSMSAETPATETAQASQAAAEPVAAASA
jgi:MFS family permease